MARFTYTATNSKGREISGTIDAKNYHDALKTLESSQYEVLRLRRAGGLEGLIQRFTKGVKGQEVALFCRQVGVMFETGVPIRRAFQVMSLQGFSPYFSDVISRVEADVSEGSSLSRALGRHPDVFSMLFVGMVKAGENSGKLDKVLNRLADHLDKEVLIKQKLKSSMTYPAFVFVLATIMATIIVQHILPTFINGVFKAESLELPLMTKGLIFVTNFLNDGRNLTYMGVGLVVFLFFFSQFAKTAQGRFQIQSVMHNLPGIRNVVRTLLASRFCRVFSSLVESGLPIVHSLDLTSAALGDYVVAPRFEQVKTDMRDGGSLTYAVARMDIFPPMLLEFLSIGEESGRIAPLLEKLADIYDEDIDNAVEAYTSLLEPLMLLIMGILVGYVVIAVFIPLYQLVGSI